jgi:thymidylate synthase
MLIFGNPKSQVGICTLWTKKELVAEKLDQNKFAVMGNLYSPRKGISFLFRNLLANPNIRHLIILGLDNSKSGQALADFFDGGFERFEDEKTNTIYWKIRSGVDNRIDYEIDKAALDLLRVNINFIDLRKENDLSKVQSIINNLKQDLESYASKPLLFPDPEKSDINMYPSEPAVHVVRGAKISEVWVKILDEIIRFGVTDKTSYQNRQKEILDLTSIITDEDPENLQIPEWLPNDRDHLRNYLPTILTAKCPAGASYTYGSRMRSYFGVDQVQKAVDELLHEKYTRRAVINLLDPRVDCNSKNPPCLNHCWFRIQNDKIYLVATIRSNDMFEAWPENAFGLRMLQFLVYKSILAKYPEVKLGDLVIHSQSAHIYDDSWDEAKNIIQNHYIETVKHPRNEIDPRGNFLIKTDDDEIIVEHYSHDELLLSSYKGKNAMLIYLRISRDRAISNINHAIYLGTELQKAEESIRLRIQYEQDKDLKYKRK